jgi:hypothetical protein
MQLLLLLKVYYEDQAGRNNTDCNRSPTSLPVPTNDGIILRNEGSVVKAWAAIKPVNSVKRSSIKAGTYLKSIHTRLKILCKNVFNSG